MRRINKTQFILKDNSGETIVEVLVAFTLLSIMLVIFSQGIAWASKAEVNAHKSRVGADQALELFEKDMANGARDPYPTQLGYLNGRINRGVRTYTVDGATYTYTYYEAVKLNN